MGLSEAARPQLGAEGRVAPAPLAWRRNFICLVVDGAIFFFALALVDTTSVLPALLRRLTDQPILIGLLGSVYSGSWLLPQLFAARFASSRRRKLPWVIAATTTGRAFWLILFVALASYAQLPTGVVVLACYVAVIGFWCMDGISSLLWYDLIARTIPPRVRGRMFGVMSLSGGVMAAISGFAVGRIVGHSGLPFPADYQVLLGLALIIFIIGVIPLVLMHEPSGPEPTPAEPIRAYIGRLPRLLSERLDFRRLVMVQLLVGWTNLAVPFYAPYGLDHLRLPESNIGVFVLMTAVGTTLGGLAWGYLGDRGHHHVAVRGVAILSTISPALTVVIGRFAHGIDAATLVFVYAVPFLLVGASVRGAWIAFANYLLEIAEPGERSVLIGLMNTLAGSLALAPSVGGALASWLGYEATFVVAVIPTLAGLLVSLRMRRPAALHV